MARPNPKNSLFDETDPGMGQFQLPESDVLLSEEERRKKLLQQRSPAAQSLFGQQTLGDAASMLFGSAGTALK